MFNWRAMESPTSVSLDHVWGTARNNVFAAATWGETILHYDGLSWRDMEFPQPAEAPIGRFSEMASTGPDDMFLLGAFKNHQDEWTGVVLHHDGDEWDLMADRFNPKLERVSATEDGDIFAISDDGLIYRFDGTTWTLFFDGIGEQFDPDTFIEADALWARSQDDLFVAFHQENDAPKDVAKFFHFDGNEWNEEDFCDAQVVPFVDKIWGRGKGTDAMVSCS